MPHIGIYSGTFDPVHAGHLAFANAATEANRLDYVVFMPEEQPRGKTNVSDIDRRVLLLRDSLATTNHTVYRANQPRFTIAETLPELIEKYQGATLSFLLGSDVVSSLPKWPDVELLIANHTLIIGMRAHDHTKDIASILDQLGASYTIVTTPHAHVSSSQLRLAS